MFILSFFVLAFALLISSNTRKQCTALLRGPVGCLHHGASCIDKSGSERVILPLVLLSFCGEQIAVLQDNYYRKSKYKQCY
jgi:hypothetical protein